MFEHKTRARTWGFRLVWADLVAIAVFAGCAAYGWHLASPLWWMILIAAGHFFLFCNVFRVVRRREFIWAGTFIVNIGLWLWAGELGCLNVLAVQLPVTVILILADMRAPGYHGIFADRLNPRLCDYLKGRI